MKTTKQEINLEILPEEGRRELIDFYEYLVNKYKKKTKQSGNKQKRLREILSNPIGMLPNNYQFNRGEV